MNTSDYSQLRFQFLPPCKIPDLIVLSCTSSNTLAENDYENFGFWGQVGEQSKTRRDQTIGRGITQSPQWLSSNKIHVVIQDVDKNDEGGNDLKFKRIQENLDILTQRASIENTSFFRTPFRTETMPAVFLWFKFMHKKTLMFATHRDHSLSLSEPCE